MCIRDSCQILAAARLFDGINFPQENMAVLIEADKIAQVGTLAELSGICANPVSYTHLRAHETVLDLVCRLLLEKKK